MKLSIIIVNYNSRKYLDKCLASVFAKTTGMDGWEIIVVNNGKEEELFGLEKLFSKVKIIKNQKNTGFGAANNLGASLAQGDILFFLNPDTEIISQNITQLIAEFEKEDNLGVLGLRLEKKLGVAQEWIAGDEVSLWNILRNNLGISLAKKHWQSEKKISVAWVAGTAFLIKKDFFDQLGGFDSRFFMYFEDVDLCHRARLLGRKVVYFPHFSILHHGGKSFSKRKEQKKAYYQSQDYYFKKHRSIFERWLLKILRLFSF